MKNKQSLQALRARIALLKTERSELLNQRRSRVEVLDALESQLQDYAVRGRAKFARGLHMLAAGSAGSPFLLTGVAGADNVARIDIGPVLVAMVGIDRMREVYLAEIASVPEGLSKAERTARLAEIASELDSAETDEEALIVQSESTELPIARRADARPEIILGATDGH